MHDDTPFEYYDGKLGCKLSFLIYEGKKQCHPKSLRVISYHGLESRMRRKTSKERRLRKACLNNEALVLFSSLDREWKDQLTTKFGNPKEEATSKWFADFYIADREANEFYITHRYGDNNEHKLDGKLVEEYTYNASVLNAVLSAKIDRRNHVKTLGFRNLNMWESLSRDVNGFTEVPHTLPKSPDGLRKKANQYAALRKKSHEEAFRFLVSGKLLNKNASVTKDHDAQIALIKKLRAKHTNLNAQFIADLYNTIASEMGWKTITRQTVMNIAPDTDMAVYAGRNGTRDLTDNKLMQVKRKRPSSSMLYWTLDGWDAELVYQETRTDRKGKTTTTYHNRLTVVVVLDAHNNYPIGYAIGTHETPGLIKTAIQNAIRHTQELFGELFMPYQIQSDRYAIKKMMPVYAATSKHVTPSKVKNAKSKVVEPYFNYLNENRCKMFDNWSGYNTDSGSKNQPNAEWLNIIKKSFPDREGCENQLHQIMAMERSKRGAAFAKAWENTPNKYRQIMSEETYLFTFGSTTGETNTLKGAGLIMTIDSIKYSFDSFEPAFRKHSAREWQVRFDRNDLSKALAVSTDGSLRFMLEKKWDQAMAIADRQEGDMDQLKRVWDYNDDRVKEIELEHAYNAELVDSFYNDNPQLNDTLGKLLLTDSHGQHKNQKSQQRLQAAKSANKINQKTERKKLKQQARTFADEQAAYHQSKVDVNEYLS